MWWNNNDRFPENYVSLNISFKVQWPNYEVFKLSFIKYGIDLNNLTVNFEDVYREMSVILGDSWLRYSTSAKNELLLIRSYRRWFPQIDKYTEMYNFKIRDVISGKSANEVENISTYYKPNGSTTDPMANKHFDNGINTNTTVNNTVTNPISNLGMMEYIIDLIPPFQWLVDRIVEDIRGSLSTKERKWIK